MATTYIPWRLLYVYIIIYFRTISIPSTLYIYSCSQKLGGVVLRSASLAHCTRKSASAFPHYSTSLTSIGLQVFLQRKTCFKLTRSPPLKFILKNPIPGLQKALALFGVSPFVLIHILGLKKFDTITNVPSFHLGQRNFIPSSSCPDWFLYGKGCTF